MSTYRVWAYGQKPEQGVKIEADSSFEARMHHAKALQRLVSEVMARKEA